MGKSKVNAKNAKKTDVWYKVLAIVIGVVLLFGLIVAIMQPTGLMDYVTLHVQTAMKTEHYSVSNAQFMYLTHLTYNNYYQTYYENYSSYMSSFGLDRSLPLSQQKYLGSSTTSWLDKCVDEVTSSMTQTLALCEAARAAGFELKDDDKKTIDDTIQSLKDFAKKNNYSVTSAIAAMYGSKGITKGDIKGVLEMQILATRYAEKLTEDYSYTDEQINSYYDENKLNFIKADYYSYEVKADYESGATDEEKEAAISAAKNKAEELHKKIEDGADFVTVIMDYKKELAQAELDAAQKAYDDAKAAETETATDTTTTGTDTTGETTKSAEETALDNAKKALEDITEESVKKEILTEAHTTSTTATKTEAEEWMFADAPAADGATKLISSDESATIYQIVKSAYRDEYNTITIRELDMSLDDFTSPEAMKEYAEGIIADFNAGSEKTGDAFDKLAEKYTTDKITVSSRGQIKETKMSTSTDEKIIAVNDWLFSSDRKSGDVKYFEFTDEGVSIYFYEETGRVAWLVSVDSSMRSADLEKDIKSFEETYPVTINEKAIASIE